MTLTIIGIHGLANKPAKDVLATAWESSIREGLKHTSKIKNPGIAFRNVHWADLLYKNFMHDDEAFDFDDLYNREPYQMAKPGAIKMYKDTWVDEARHIGETITGKFLDKARESLNVDFGASRILDKHLKDLAFYYDDKRRIKDRKASMRIARNVLMDELESEIRAAKRETPQNPIMVVSHSMGTIIAYDVLRNIGQSNDRFDVEYFVTIGSPLGLPHVKANIYDSRKHYAKKNRSPLRTPTIVSKAWHNFADRGDPVAFDSHLSDDFDVNDQGLKVVDDLVSNDYIGLSGKRNRHKSYGYLRTPERSELISGAL